MRSTHNAFQGVVMTSFGSRCPYFWLCLVLPWQDWQVLMYLRMVVRIPFQYITDLIVSSRRECPGCWRLLECLTACKAFIHTNAKGKGINSKGWAFRMVQFSKREKRVLKREVRSLHEQEISKNLFGNFKP